MDYQLELINLWLQVQSFLGILKGSDDVDDAKVANSRKTHELDGKLRAMLREIVWQVVMFVLFTWVILGARNLNAYNQNRDIKNAFVEDAQVHIAVEAIWYASNMVLHTYTFLYIIRRLVMT